MKKFLILLIFSITIPLFTIDVFASTETFVYAPVYTEGYTWNLSTGVYESNWFYASTNKMTLQTDNIILDDDVSYILYWNKYGQYLGYNSYTANEQNPEKYLGSVGATITPPSTTKTFAVVQGISGKNTDIPDYGYSYNDIVNNPVYDYVFDSEPLSTVFGSPLMGDYQIPSIYHTDPESILTLADAFEIPDALMHVKNQMYNIADHTAYFTGGLYGIDVLELENLIVNGDFSLDTNFDGIANSWNCYSSSINSIESNGQKLLSSTGSTYMLLRQKTPLTYLSTHSYYGNVLIYKNTSNAMDFRLMNIGGVSRGYFNVVTGVNSSIFTSTENIEYFGIYTGAVLSIEYFIVDNIILLDLGVSPIYTKSQLDDLIAYYGYFEGEALLPDASNASFIDGFMYYNTGDHYSDTVVMDKSYDSNYHQYLPSNDEAYFDDWLQYYFYTDETGNPDFEYGDYVEEYLSGINPYELETYLDYSPSVDGYTPPDWLQHLILLYRDAQIDPNLEHWEWYNDYNVTESNFDYLWQLYDDSLNEVDRFEWYVEYGITSDLLYNSLLDLGLEMDYFSEESFATFSSLSILGEYELTEEVAGNIWDSFDGLFDGGTISGTTIRSLISLVVIIALSVFLLYKGANLAMVLVVDVPIFLFFVIAEWLPTWTGIVLGMISFVLFLLFVVFKSSNSSV